MLYMTSKASRIDIILIVTLTIFCISAIVTFYLCEKGIDTYSQGSASVTYGTFLVYTVVMVYKLLFVKKDLQ
jgi:hypothetical protein